MKCWAWCSSRYIPKMRNLSNNRALSGLQLPDEIQKIVTLVVGRSKYWAGRHSRRIEKSSQQQGFICPATIWCDTKDRILSWGWFNILSLMKFTLSFKIEKSIPSGVLSVLQLPDEIQRIETVVVNCFKYWAWWDSHHISKMKNLLTKKALSGLELPDEVQKIKIALVGWF